LCLIVIELMNRLRVYSVRFCNEQDSHTTNRQVKNTECKGTEIKFALFPDIVTCSWYIMASVCYRLILRRITEL